MFSENGGKNKENEREKQTIMGFFRSKTVIVRAKKIRKVLGKIDDYFDGVGDPGKRDMIREELDFLGAQASMGEIGTEEFRSGTNGVLEDFEDDGLTLFQIYNYYRKNPKFRREPLIVEFIRSVRTDEMSNNRLYQRVI